MEILALLVTGLTVSGLATVERHPSASSVSPDPNYVRCIRTPDGFFRRARLLESTLATG